MGGSESEHPGILYFYSESIGFGVNGVCAFIAALTNLGVGERDISTAVLFILIGGVMQLLCKFCVCLCCCASSSLLSSLWLVKCHVFVVTHIKTCS